jgi:diketogulonate reductase-like aldo/keto reductase
MTFGEDWGWGAWRDESRKFFNAFVEAGRNFIDTANHYRNGTSERFVGEFTPIRNYQPPIPPRAGLERQECVVAFSRGEIPTS